MHDRLGAFKAAAHFTWGEKAHSFSKGNYTEVKNSRAKIHTHCIHVTAKKKQRNLLKNLVFTDKQDLYSNKALSADIQVSDILNTAFYEQSLTAAPSRIQDFLGLLVVYKLITHFWMLMELSNVTN